MLFSSQTRICQNILYLLMNLFFLALFLWSGSVHSLSWKRSCDLREDLLKFTENVGKKGYRPQDFKKCDWGHTADDAADKIFQAFDTQSNENNSRATSIKSKFCGLFKKHEQLKSFFSEDQIKRIALKCNLIKTNF